MDIRKAWRRAASGLLCLSALYAFQRPFRQFPGVEYFTFGLTQDCPRADRHFSQAVRRLTRIHTRSVEQPVNLEEGDAYDWPWLYAVQVGEWGLSDAHEP